MYSVGNSVAVENVGLCQKPSYEDRNRFPDKWMDSMILDAWGMGSTLLPFLVRLQLTVQAGGYVQ